MCAALSTLSQLGNRDGWFGTANLLQRRNVAFCICAHSNGNGTGITPQKHRMNIACKNLIKGNSLIQSWDAAFSFYIESDGDRRQHCFQLVGQGKKLQKLSATLFTSPCKQLPSSMVADAVYGLVVPGYVPPPPPSIPPPTSSIPPPTLPRLVAQHPPKQFHSLATTQGHNHHSFRVVFHTEFVESRNSPSLCTLSHVSDGGLCICNAQFGQQLPVRQNEFTFISRAIFLYASQAKSTPCAVKRKRSSPNKLEQIRLTASSSTTASSCKTTSLTHVKSPT